MAIREGRWDCPQCGNTGIRGSVQACDGCGLVRSHDVKLYLLPDEPVVTDPEKLADAKAGPDWHCPYCSLLNDARMTSCNQCGATAAESQPRPDKRVNSLATVYAPGIKPGEGVRRRWEGAIAGLVVSLCFLAWLFWPIKVPLTVTGHEWKRDIFVEQCDTYREEDWNIPTGGREIASFRAQHHIDHRLDHYETRSRTVQAQTGTRQVKTGTRDLGNGYFEDVYSTEPVYESRTETYQEPVYVDVPVYKTRYVYDIELWRHQRTVPAAGTDKQPKWPYVAFAQGKPPYNVGAQRELRRAELYTVSLHDAKRDVTYKPAVPYVKWDSLERGQIVYVTMFRFGWVIRIEALEQ